MVVEITLERVQRVTVEVDVTKEQLEQLKRGENPFHEKLVNMIGAGTIQDDYAVNDLEGNEIVSWRN